MIELSSEGNSSFFARGQSGQWALKKDDAGHKLIPISRLPFVIGRAWDCDLLLPDDPELRKSTSRWHCYFKDDAGRAVLVDGSLHEIPDTGKHKPSVSGTWLNGERMKDPRAVAPGDKVAVGPWRFLVGEPRQLKISIDDILKTIAGQPSRHLTPSDPRVSKAFPTPRALR